MNLWNIKHSKQRLAILQKAQAQKRHLMNLINAKSVVADTSQSNSRISNSLNRSLTRSINKKDNLFASLQIQRNNKILYKKIVNTDKIQNQKPANSQCKFINITKTLSQNHSSIFKIQKNMKQRLIDEQNSKIFTRLIRTTPTIKRTQWMKQNAETQKYKESMHRSKYAKPDYSFEACRLMTSQSSKSYNLKPLNKTIRIPQSRDKNMKQSTVHNSRMRF